MARTHSATPQPLNQRVTSIQTPASSSHGSPRSAVERPALSQTSVASGSASMEEALVQGENQMQRASEDSKEFTPYQDLFKTAISLEYGDNRNEKYIVPLGLLQCYSPKLNKRFNRASGNRQLWEEAVHLRSRAKRVLIPYKSGQVIAAPKIDAVIRFIQVCAKQYPLLEHQIRITHGLEQFFEETNLFGNKDNLKNPSSTGACRKKEFKERDLMARLQELNANGITIVTRELVYILSDIKRSEKARARQDFLKAASQGRIILHGIKQETVHSVVEWVYTNKLTVKDAEKLYQVLELANDLGIQVLTETCQNMLITAFYSAITHAKAEGTSLHSLLAKDEPSQDCSSSLETLGNVVPIVFRNVLKSEKPPKALKDLVIRTLATDKDIRVFRAVQTFMTLELSLELHEAKLLVEGSTKKELASDEFAFG